MVVKSMQENWELVGRFDGLADFMNSGLFTLKEIKKIYKEYLPKYKQYLADYGECDCCISFGYFIITELGWCDEDIIKELLETKKEIYDVTYIDERHSDYFEIWIKNKEE